MGAVHGGEGSSCTRCCVPRGRLIWRTQLAWKALIWCTQQEVKTNVKPARTTREDEEEARSLMIYDLRLQKAHFCVANTQEARTPSQLSTFAACTPSTFCNCVTLVYSCIVAADRCTGQVQKMLAAPSPGESGAC